MGKGIDRRLLIGGAGGVALGASAGAAWAADNVSGAPPSIPTVRTKAGPVRGFAAGKVAVVKGVPYGASTAGAGRFKPPQKPAPWTDVRDATSYGPICPQPSFPILPEEMGSQSTEPQVEDCLVLDVWTPSLGDRAEVAGATSAALAPADPGGAGLAVTRLVGRSVRAHLALLTLVESVHTWDPGGWCD